MKRKHISWKTKCAAALLDAMAQRERFGLNPARWYDEAKKMTEDQFLSLFHWDHNILHETGDPDVDKYWNLTPMLIQAHRIKTKADAKIIAKGKRLRDSAVISLRIGPDGQYQTRGAPRPGAAVIHPARTFKRKIASRGFDKRFRKKMSGKVEKR